MGSISRYEKSFFARAGIPYHMKNKLFGLMLLFIVLSVSACKDEVNPVLNETASDKPEFGVDWKSWTPDVFAQAKEQNRLVLVDLTADWCQLCKKMDMSTWLDSQVHASIEEYYIPVRVQDEVDTELAERYRQYGRPAIVILDGNGVEIAKKTGFQDALRMHWMLEGVAQNPTSKANL